MSATQGEAIPQLTRWGLSPDADLAYRALVMVGRALPSELARSLGMPAARVRAALDELASAGAARPSGRGREPVRSWAPLPGHQVLDVLRHRRHRQPAEGERWRRHVA
ncbi:MAG TPA: hypothetical protein VFT95_20445, partial [Micromonosporaceae bacterium]|nr:hypothetical protein [Micromonosporaceae bacterium]